MQRIIKSNNNSKDATEAGVRQTEFTAGGSVGIALYINSLVWWFEKLLPVLCIGVTEFRVLRDKHISITDFSEGPQAQVGDM